MAKNSRQIMASPRVMELVVALPREVSRKRTMRAVEIKSKMGISLRTVSLLTLMGWMRAPTPISRSTLMMLLPMTLPRSMSVEPEAREEIETASSGALVPKAMMVRPIKVLLTLKLVATDDAPSTSQSAPFTNITKPIISKSICNIISISLL